MAENIVYPNGGYGIMPNDAFNKYLRFQNQRRATTGMGATPADQKAFWEGTMDSVVKGASSRAAQNLEQKRLDSTINYQNRQLEEAGKDRESKMWSGLAQYPATYMMYRALGFGGKNNENPWEPIKGIKKGWNWLTGGEEASPVGGSSEIVGGFTPREYSLLNGPADPYSGYNMGGDRFSVNPYLDQTFMPFVAGDYSLTESVSPVASPSSYAEPQYMSGSYDSGAGELMTGGGYEPPPYSDVIDTIFFSPGE